MIVTGRLAKVTEEVVQQYPQDWVLFALPYFFSLVVISRLTGWLVNKPKCMRYKDVDVIDIRLKTGVLRTMDCLRLAYFAQQLLDAASHETGRRRIRLLADASDYMWCPLSVRSSRPAMPNGAERPQNPEEPHRMRLSLVALSSICGNDIRCAWACQWWIAYASKGRSELIPALAEVNRHWMTAVYHLTEFERTNDGKFILLADRSSQMVQQLSDELKRQIDENPVAIRLISAEVKMAVAISVLIAAVTISVVAWVGIDKSASAILTGVVGIVATCLQCTNLYRNRQKVK
jgi:hypothetical protein